MGDGPELKGGGDLRGLLDQGVEIADRPLVVAELETRTRADRAPGSSGFAFSEASAVCKASVARSFVVAGAAATLTLKSIRVNCGMLRQLVGNFVLAQTLMEDARIRRGGFCQMPQ